MFVFLSYTHKHTHIYITLLFMEIIYSKIYHDLLKERTHNWDLFSTSICLITVRFFPSYHLWPLDGSISKLQKLVHGLPDFPISGSHSIPLLFFFFYIRFFKIWFINVMEKKIDISIKYDTHVCIFNDKLSVLKRIKKLN